jgi:glycine/D-amino acid oxidase-like deaminating enzyme
VRLEKDVNFEGWMGHRPLVPDDVAVISRVGKHDNVVVATGVSGRGMTQCLGVGVVVSELLSGSKAENLADYDLKRFLFI